MEMLKQTVVLKFIETHNRTLEEDSRLYFEMLKEIDMKNNLHLGERILEQGNCKVRKFEKEEFICVENSELFLWNFDLQGNPIEVLDEIHNKSWHFQGKDTERWNLKGESIGYFWKPHISH